MDSKEMTLESFMKAEPVVSFKCNRTTQEAFKGLRKAFSKGGEVVSNETKTMFEKWTKSQPRQVQPSRSGR